MTQIVSARFQPNVTLIKKQIEVLVEKEYLERQEGARDTYNYVRFSFSSSLPFNPTSSPFYATVRDALC